MINLLAPHHRSDKTGLTKAELPKAAELPQEMPKANNVDPRVFYLKIKGDYYQHLAKAAIRDAKAAVVDDSLKAHQDSFDTSKSTMQPTHNFIDQQKVSHGQVPYLILNNADQMLDMARARAPRGQYYSPPPSLTRPKSSSRTRRR